jgi:hypothetical protein
MCLVGIPPVNISSPEKLFPAPHERSVIDKFQFDFLHFSFRLTPLFPLREGQANHALMQRQVKWSFAEKI